MDRKLRNTYFASVLLGLLTFGLTLTFLSLKRAARADACSGPCVCGAMAGQKLEGQNDVVYCNPGTLSQGTNGCVCTLTPDKNSGACPPTPDGGTEYGTIPCPVTNPPTAIAMCCPGFSTTGPGNTP